MILGLRSSNNKGQEDVLCMFLFLESFRLEETFKIIESNRFTVLFMMLQLAEK